MATKKKSTAPKSDIDIARAAKTKPIADVAAKLDIPASALLQYGPTKAKISLDYVKKVKRNKDGKLILVTAISPTPAGEGNMPTCPSASRSCRATTSGAATAASASRRRRGSSARHRCRR